MQIALFGPLDTHTTFRFSEAYAQARGLDPEALFAKMSEPHAFPGKAAPVIIKGTKLVVNHAGQVGDIELGISVVLQQLEAHDAA